MITLDFEYHNDSLSGDCSFKCTASGGSPFLKRVSDDVFINVASPADMELYPDSKPQGATDGLWRSDVINMIFRSKSVRDEAVKSVEEQVADLNSITLSEITGGVLYSNIS